MICHILYYPVLYYDSGLCTTQGQRMTTSEFTWRSGKSKDIRQTFARGWAEAEPSKTRGVNKNTRRKMETLAASIYETRGGMDANRKQETENKNTRNTRNTTDWLTFSGTTLTSGLWFCSNCSLSTITVTFLFTVSAFISLLPPSGDQWRLIYSHLILVGKVPTALYSRYDGLAS